MARGLAVFGLVLAALYAVAACGLPRIDPDARSLAQAQATNVKRTAAAEVQRIIANNPPATSTRLPTQTPPPDCRGAIWWHEARSRVGESRSVQGPVVGVRAALDSRVLIEIGQPYPDPTGFVVVAPSTNLPNLERKIVCAAGRIIKIEGVPSLQLTDASAIGVIGAQP